MYEGWTKEEVEELKKFRLIDRIPASAAFHLSDFHTSRHVRERIATTGGSGRILERQAAASILVKRLSFLAVIYFHSMTAFNRRPILDAEKIYVAEHEKEGLRLLDFYFDQPSMMPYDETIDRSIWLKEGWEYLFHEWLMPVFDVLKEEVRISEYILWENTAVYLYWLYETVLEDRPQALQDFEELIHPGAFQPNGMKGINPFNKFYFPKSLNGDGKEVRMRKTCCLSYLSDEKGTRCQTCPLFCHNRNLERGESLG
ncbi:IucA/IucC family C-terminal-domain containing protein [Falsibacillus pallidus]|uniref:Ferric iron reductase protein FhuF n=1 Tax=Falsibacillus pallidus TaxID=493781 RepID=A0A370GC71_9BACI|nr:IucA/IucC family C-terminal-domain containing protein [Falsibacillus pallidus]RDI41415.1 ferric iron reductase protein FhuF [Falsibacillus pallidus]